VRSRPGAGVTPATVYAARPKVSPSSNQLDSHDLVRRDHVDKAGKTTLRHDAQLYSIGIGRTHTRTHTVVLVHDITRTCPCPAGFLVICIAVGD